MLGLISVEYNLCLRKYQGLCIDRLESTFFSIARVDIFFYRLLFKMETVSLAVVFKAEP